MLSEEERLAVSAASWAMITYDKYAVARCGSEYLAGEGNAEMLAEFLCRDGRCPEEEWDLGTSVPIIRLPRQDIRSWYPGLKKALAGRFMIVEDIEEFRMEHPPEYVEEDNPWFQV
jgi:hypothetical protein